MKYQIDEYILDVQIIRKNNKNTYIRLKDSNTIYVTTGFFTTKSYIKSLLDNNQKFLIKAIKKYNNNLEKDNKFYFLGISYNVVFSSNFKKVEIDYDNRNIFASNDRMLNKWLSKYICELYLNRLNYIYNMFEEKIPYPKLRIRNMKTRWGVCNRSNNTVTLNSKLIKYDLKKLDYVIVHELSHFVHFNHSKSFWQEVYKYCPNYKKIRKELNE